MLRRREAELKRSAAEVRHLRRKLGLDDPDPEPDAAPIPLHTKKTKDTEVAQASVPSRSTGATQAPSRRRGAAQRVCLPALR